MIKWVNKGTKLLYSAMFGAIMLILIIFQDKQPLGKKDFLLSNILLLAIGVFLVLLFNCLASATGKLRLRHSQPPYRKIVNILGVVLFLGQMYLAYNIYFDSGWDVGTVLNNAKLIAAGNTADLSHHYFSMYPNNLFLVSVYAFIMKLNHAVGIFPGDQYLLSLILINCFCSSASCVLIYRILEKLLNPRYAFLGFFLGAASFGISPWVVVCYSDAVGIFLPILMLYLFMWKVKGWKSIVRYISMALLSVVCYSVKPQTVIILIAILMVEFVHIIGKKEFKKLAFSGLLVFLGLAIALTGFKALDRVYAKEGFRLDPEAEYGMTHFLMMGLNKERSGVFSSEDVIFSGSFQTKAERQSANIDMAKERIKNFGVAGLSKHLTKKVLINYNDGTFSWYGEGSFCTHMYDQPNSRVAPILRNIYFPDGAGYGYWQTAEQGVWMCILFLCLCAGIFKGKDKNSKYYSILFLSIIGLTAFELIFECRARYLYTYVPIYCIIAVCGLYGMRVKIKKAEKYIGLKIKNRQGGKL